MKKFIPALMILFLGITGNLYAGTGNARDGFLLAGVVIGVLAAIYGLLFFINFIHKNGKSILKKIIGFLSHLSHEKPENDQKDLSDLCVKL